LTGKLNKIYTTIFIGKKQHELTGCVGSDQHPMKSVPREREREREREER
jgi:hypothetical protein